MSRLKLRRGINPEVRCHDFVSVYIDDVLVFSQNPCDHLRHLKLVVDCLQRAGLKLEPSKCHFEGSTLVT